LEDSSLFKARFPEVKNYVGQTGFGLSGSGEFMKLMNDKGEGIDSLTYSDRAPWPTEADGKGATLELVDPASDNARGENWKASVGHGSPGRKNSTTTSIDEKVSRIIPDTYALMQNYPNPFNPVTTIRFSINKDENVKLIVYDVLGNEVATIVNERLIANTYDVTWDASSYSSGVYFYRIIAGNDVSVKKMMMVK
jgi:hypothetical protein